MGVYIDNLILLKVYHHLSQKQSKKLIIISFSVNTTLLIAKLIVKPITIKQK